MHYFKQLSAFAFALVLLSPAVFSIGLSPASVAIEDVLKGGYAEKTFTIYNTEPETRVFSFKIGGGLASWASAYPQDTFVVDGGQKQEIKVVVQPPQDAASGTYDGEISVSSKPQTPSFSTGARADIQAGVVGHLALTVTNSQKPGLSVNSIEGNAIEERMPAFIKFDLTNPGNVRARPLISVDIADSHGKLLASVSKQDSEILPTHSATILMQLPTEDLPQGDYSLKISVSLGGQQIYGRALRQEILEVGALSRRGQIVELKVPPWAELGSYAKIEVLFRNLGTLGSTAKLSGEILVDGKPIAPISSEEVDVLPGQQVALATLYKPGQPGRHTVHAAVLFGGKLTEYTDGVINVNGTGASSQGVNYNAIALLAALAVLAAIAYAFRNKFPRVKLVKKWK